MIVCWLILALMGAVTFLYGVSTHAALLCLLVIPLPLLALLGWLHDAPPSDYRRWISLVQLPAGPVGHRRFGV
ncbi:hypothetical protein PspCFBP13508_07290 [Pseudomonas sp. CFBP13508]|nr:hypothetical protein PspCFBP13508_07290 [Pseudomonas sp. CFBP13508]